MRSWSAHTITDEAQNPPADQQTRASWYAQGVSDAVGDRLLMFDDSRGPSLELLRFSWRVAGSIEFEDALRERVEVLSHFSHEAFAKIRAVEKLDPHKDLTLVSNYIQASGCRSRSRAPRPRVRHVGNPGASPRSPICSLRAGWRTAP
jgi:hypothetical protein